MSVVHSIYLTSVLWSSYETEFHKELSTDVENKLVVAKGEGGWRRDGWGAWG